MINGQYLKRLFLLCIAVTFLTGCTGATPEPPSYWPTQDWRTSTPEEQGMSSERLADMLGAIQQQDHGIDGVSVIRNGYMVIDATVHPFRPGSKHIIHSCTKSLISALIGIAIDKGHIESVNQPVLDFFPGRTVANLDADKERMTLEHLLTMTSGLKCRDSYLYRWRGLNQMMQSEDWIQFMLDLPMAEAPGSRFEYCNGVSFLLSAIIQQTTGMSALAFAEEHLFSPLGISDVVWPSNPEGITIGWGELHMKPHDMAKIGYLYLNKGSWDGKQVIPASWVKASTRKHVSATLEDGYGYQWWVDASGIYMALGYAGQFIFVVPEKDMVVVFVSDLEEQDFYVPQRLLNDFIIPAAESSTPLPNNPEGMTLLESRLKALAAPPVSLAETVPSPTATKTSLPPTATPVPSTETPTPTDTPTSPTATVTPTPTEQPSIPPTATTPATRALVVDVVAGLERLPLRDFFQESYKQLLLRSPEKLTALGIAGSYNLRNDQLDNLSDAYIRETQELEAAILDLLRTYDRAGLTPEQQVSYDIYEWYLDDLVRGHKFMYYDYPVHHFLGSYHDELIQLFTETHPLTSGQDAKDYVSRLSQVDDQVDQLLESLKLREEAGAIPPTFIIELTRNKMMRYLRMRSPDPASIGGESLSVYTVFNEKLGKLDDLSARERQALLDAALTKIKESFIPAYVKLLDYLEYLATISTDDAGVWKFPNGDAYYAYLLRNQTSTDLTPTEIHALGLAEVARIQTEMRKTFDELGYPQDKSLSELMDRAVRDAGFYDIRTQAGKDQLIEAYEAILDQVNQRLDVAFDIRPKAKVVVVGGPMGGYYVPGSSDGSRPGAFHVGTDGSWASKFNMATVACHEAIPGHHFQIAIAQELDLPTFRKDLFFNGYGEGWALYAEQLVWELGLYDDDPYGNLGRLDLELLRAVRLVVDTGIHAKLWTREKANEYMAEALGAPPGTHFYEVDRYIVRPAQATGYKIGMLKILELRQQAMDQLGEHFDLKEFHNVVLGNGSMPLEILDQVVETYIETK